MPRARPQRARLHARPGVFHAHRAGHELRGRGRYEGRHRHEHPQDHLWHRPAFRDVLHRLPRDIVIIGHSGSGDADISTAKPTLKVVPVFTARLAAATSPSSTPGHGIITFLGITQDGDGNFKFVVAEGENVDGPIFTFGDTNMRMKFSIGAREFMNRWNETGPTHHMAACLGSQTDTILKVAKILNVPVDVVCR